MERRRLRRDIEALLYRSYIMTLHISLTVNDKTTSFTEEMSRRGDYIGQRLRENGFDPKGKRVSTVLDDLAHYDLAIAVALHWLNEDEGGDGVEKDTRCKEYPRPGRYPNRLEREAMILSSFAGTVLNRLPVEDVLCLYRCKPSTTYAQRSSQSPIVHPFTLSSHPFAMLTAYEAVERAKKHTQRLQFWKSEKCKLGNPADQNLPTQPSTPSSTERSLSVSGDSTEEAEDRNGSEESFHAYRDTTD